MEILYEKAAYGSSYERRPRILKAQFGDGYMQVARDGINHNPVRINATFKADEERAVILKEFFEARGGDEAFLWIPPAPYSSPLRAWRLMEWDHPVNEYNDHNFTGIFEEVFETIPIVTGVGVTFVMNAPTFMLNSDGLSQASTWLDPAPTTADRRFYLTSDPLDEFSTFYWRHVVAATVAELQAEDVDQDNGTLYTNNDVLLGELITNDGDGKYRAERVTQPSQNITAGDKIRIGSYTNEIFVAGGDAATAFVSGNWRTTIRETVTHGGGDPTSGEAYILDMTGPTIPPTTASTAFAALLIRGYNTYARESFVKRIIYALDNTAHTSLP